MYLGTNNDFGPILQRLVFITEMESVYCAVGNGSLNSGDCVSSLKGYVTVAGLLLGNCQRAAISCALHN